MYRNLEAEMFRKGVTNADIAKYLGVHYSTVFEKTNGGLMFYYDEAHKIKKHFFPNCALEDLFNRDEQSTARQMVK